MQRLGRRVVASSLTSNSRRLVPIRVRSFINAHFSNSACVRPFSSIASEKEAFKAFEKAKALLDSDDIPQAMECLSIAACANIADAQYMLGFLLLNENDVEDESDTQQQNKQLIQDAEAHRQHVRRVDDAHNIKEIRKSARAAYKQYLSNEKHKKHAKYNDAIVIEHASTQHLDRAFGKTMELFLNPNSKLELLLENHKDHDSEDAIDTTKAVEWLRRAADNHNRDAHVKLGNLCLRHDPPMALEASAWYTRVTKDKNPHPDALYNLGVMLYEGVEHAEPPFPGNKLASIPFFTRAAEKGDISAQFFMGVLLHQGEKDLGIEPNFKSGWMLLEMAATNGHPAALYYLAQLYRSGDEKHAFAADRTKFLEFLDKAMESGDPDAFFCMADIYYHGSDGFDQDYEQAHNFYMAAAEQGHANAFCCLGTLYYNGIGVQQDFEKAFLYYQEAADRDSMEAWKNLAEMYTTGCGVPRNEATANAIMKMLEKVQADGV